MADSNQYVKTFYKLLQCIHHLNIAEDQLKGNLSKAFKTKYEQLNDFIKPAFPNNKTQNVIEDINRTWTTNTLKALQNHYTDGIATLTNTIHKIDNKQLLQSAIERALVRARKNFGRKLKHDTLIKFRETCETLQNYKADSQETTHKPTQDIPNNTAPNTTTRHTPNTQSSNNTNDQTPNQTATTNDTTKHKTAKSTRIPVAQKPNTQQHTKQTNKENEQQNPTRKQYKTRAKTHQENISKRTNTSPPKGTKTKHPQTYFKSDWKLEPSSHETLVIGDSNLRYITERNIPTNVRVECYPGARIQHMTDLASKYPNNAQKPKQIVLNIGLNDNRNNPKTTTKPALRQMIKTLQTKFPDSKLFIPEIIIPPKIERVHAYTKNLQILNEALKESKLNLIPKLNESQVLFETRDRYHWTPDTTNRCFNHWLNHLN